MVVVAVGLWWQFGHSDSGVRCQCGHSGSEGVVAVWS